MDSSRRPAGDFVAEEVHQVLDNDHFYRKGSLQIMSKIREVWWISVHGLPVRCGCHTRRKGVLACLNSLASASVAGISSMLS